MGIQTRLGVEGPFPSLHQGPPFSILWVGLQGPRNKGRPRGLPVGGRGERKEALECPGLRQPGLRHRAGKQHPHTMRLEYGAGLGLPSARTSPVAMVTASNLSKQSLP